MSVRVTALLIFMLSLWAFLALAPQNPRDDQIVTRIGLVASIVDEGSVRIDRFSDWTIDKATFDGHVYADKVPGHPLLAVPVVALDKLVRQMTGQPTDAKHWPVFFDYARWSTMLVNCPISALAVALIFVVATGLGASRAGAVFASFTAALATPFLGWSTAFFAHSVTGSFLIFALALLLHIFPPGDGSRTVRLSLAAFLFGLILGYTAVVDLTAAPAVALLGLYALICAVRAQSAFRFLVPTVIGGLIGITPLLVYNAIAFGSPFHLGYSNTDFEGMQQGLFGITWPNPAVAMQLLFGIYRGLLPLAPVLLLVPFGLICMTKTPSLRGLANLIAALIVIYFWINASYAYWYGGRSTGPRHLVAALPLASLALAFIWPARTRDRVLVSILLAVSVAVSVLCALGSMFAPELDPNPFFDYVLPMAWQPSNIVPALLVAIPIAGFAVLLIQANRSLAPKTG